METAKVDIRKLQLLNDRINQCIDALNQVRLSVHGLSAGAAGMQAGLGTGQGVPPGLEQLGGLSHSGFGQSPFAQQGMGVNPSVPFGFGSPIGQLPITGYPPALTGNPFAQAQGFGIGVNPFVAGLSHTTPEAFDPFRRPIWADPYLTARITQTFPYAQLPIPPVVTIY